MWYETRWTRYFEDSTWLTTMVDGSAAPMTASRFAAMVACGVNMPSFDQLAPEGARIASLVWSWAQGEPSTDSAGACATQRSGGRFAAESCGEVHRAACVTAGGTWTLTPDPVAWAGASAACPAGTTFAVPRNAPQNLALKAAKDAAGVADVWLAYAATGNGWSA